AGTDSPNAARLFVHYVLTREGIEPQMVDGKIPTNTEVKMPDDEPSGLMSVVDKVFGYNAASALDDWDSRQDWQDFWRAHYRRRCRSARHDGPSPRNSGEREETRSEKDLTLRRRPCRFGAAAGRGRSL